MVTDNTNRLSIGVLDIAGFEIFGQYSANSSPLADSLASREQLRAAANQLH